MIPTYKVTLIGSITCVEADLREIDAYGLLYGVVVYRYDSS